MPSRLAGANQWRYPEATFRRLGASGGITAAGTVPVLHRIPFSFWRHVAPETVTELYNATCLSRSSILSRLHIDAPLTFPSFDIVASEDIDTSSLE